MKIKLTSVYVVDQEKALRFYTEVLGFREEGRLHPGAVARWLTVALPGGPGRHESLQPSSSNDNPAAKVPTSQAMFHARPARGHVLHRRRAGRLRAHESARRRVHNATDGRDRLQDRQG